MLLIYNSHAGILYIITLLCQVKDVVEQMATLYQQLHTDGCVHFDDLLIFVYCDPERKSAITIRLRNLSERPMEGDKGGSITDQCKSVITFLQGCIESWRTIMEMYRE